MAMSNADWARALAAIRYGSGGGTGNVSLKDLQKFAKSQSNMYGSPGSGVHQSTIGSIGSAFKNAGTVGLNALSVPQAMLFTLGSKTVDALTGGKMKSTMGWDEMAGGFSPNYHGYKEIIQQVGEPMGLSKDSALGTWGGLAGDVDLDPVLFVGPAQLAKEAGTVAKLADAAIKAPDAGRFAAGISKDAGTAAMLNKFAMTPTEKALDLNRTSRALSNDAGTMAMLKKFAKTTPYPPVAPPSTMGNAADALKSAKVTLRVEGGGKGINVADQQVGRTRGTQIGDFFIHEVAPRSRKKGGPPAKVKIYRLAQPGRLHSEDVALSPNFTSGRDAEKWLRARINEVGGTGPNVEPRLTNLGPNGAPNLHDVPTAFDAHRVSSAEQFNGAKNQLGIKFGIGKANPKGGRGLNGANFTVRTPVPLKANMSLGALGSTGKVSEFFKRTPFAKSVNQQARAANEMQTAAKTEQTVTARAMSGLTHEDAKLVTWAAALDNASHPGIEGQVLAGTDKLVPVLKTAGNWTPEMSLALKYAQGRMGSFREMNAFSDKTFRALSPFAQNFTREVANFVQDSLKAGVENAKIDSRVNTMVKVAVRDRKISKAEADVILGTTEGKGRTRGPYLQQLLDPASRKAKQQDALRGFIGSKTAAPVGRDVARTHETMMNYYTKDEWAAELQSLGVEPTLAHELAKGVDTHLTQLEKTFYKDKPGQVGFSTESISSKPETDLFHILGESDAKAIHKSLMYSINQTAVMGGFAHAGKDGKLIFTSTAHEKMYNTAVKSLQAGDMASNKGWQKYMGFVSGLKMFMTSAQAVHYMGNATGDYFKALVHGNHRHWGLPTGAFQLAGTLGGRATKGSRFAKLVSGDPKVLDAPFMKIGGNEYSGAEVLWMTHMIGLGKGFAGAEISKMMHIFDKTEGMFGVRHLKQYMRWSARQNHTREDAVRIQTWVRHVESGDDLMTAGLKTIRDHFDYNDLTDFEKNIMRNLILFYTWSRKNIPFQVKAMGSKPGLYNAYGRMEADRPKMANEPDYISALGAIPLPLIGGINISAPWADLNKIPTSLSGARDSIRQNILGGAAPGLKQLLELGYDKNSLTGGAAFKNDPNSLFGSGALDYLLHQYNPVTSQATKIGDQGLSPAGIITDLGNITGLVRRVTENPDWAKQAAARKKAGK